MTNEELIRLKYAKLFEVYGTSFDDLVAFQKAEEEEIRALREELKAKEEKRKRRVSAVLRFFKPKRKNDHGCGKQGETKRFHQGIF